MEIEQIEKQFHMWIHFLWMITGASVTFVAVSLGNLVYGSDWPGFGNYMGGIWTTIQFLALLPGLYLVFHRRWKFIPLARRVHTIFGYFIAAWISLLAFGFLVEIPPATDYYILLIGSAIAIVIIYIWALRKTFIPRDEVFP
jgi:hypothetical protein